MSKTFGFKSAEMSEKLIVQEDAFDDKTMCKRCGVADTFGYRCVHCKDIHCESCLPFTVHRCEEWRVYEESREASRRSHDTKHIKKFSVCSHPDCGAKLMTDMHCFFCNKVFCSSHKMENDHECPDAVLAKKIQKSIPETKPKNKRTVSSAPLAFPSDLHVDDRFLLNVVLPPANLLPVPEAAKAQSPFKVLVHRRWSAGKISDAISRHLGQQGAKGTPPVRFVFVKAESLVALSTMQSFADMYSKGVVGKGQTLVYLPERLLKEIRSEGTAFLQKQAEELEKGRVSGGCGAEAWTLFAQRLCEEVETVC